MVLRTTLDKLLHRVGMAILFYMSLVLGSQNKAISGLVPASKQHGGFWQMRLLCLYANLISTLFIMPIFLITEASLQFTRSLMNFLIIKFKLILTACSKSLGIRIPGCFNIIGHY